MRNWRMSLQRTKSATISMRWLKKKNSNRNIHKGKQNTTCQKWRKIFLNFRSFTFLIKNILIIWAVSSEFGTYRLCEQRRFRRACASTQSRQNLRCLLIQAMNQEEPSDRKPDPWPLWMAGHAQSKIGMTECSKTQIRLTGLIYW